MKKTFVVISLCLMAAAFVSCGAKDVPETKIRQFSGYSLLWNDEFDGDKLNEEIWNMEKRRPGWVNSELQEYTDSQENIFVKDGFLVIKAVKSKKAGHDYYTSGKIQTCYKKDFKYGKVVCRAKCPEGKGLWPAFWLMPTNSAKYGPWPRCGEIDIMEILGHEPKKSYATIHYGVPHEQQQGIYKLVNGSFTDSFHEFALDWEPEELRFYVDDVLVYRATQWFSGSGNSRKPFPAPFDQLFYAQLNLAVGGDWPGNPDDSTNFKKAEFKVDYVRVYQKDAQ